MSGGIGYLAAEFQPRFQWGIRACCLCSASAAKAAVRKERLCGGHKKSCGDHAVVRPLGGMPAVVCIYIKVSPLWRPQCLSLWKFCFMCVYPVSTPRGNIV